jgi:hypothetical protein
MTSYQVAQWLRQGIAAAKAGDVERATELLMKVVDVDELNEQAWLWLSSVVESDADREACLENVLAINPDNKLAIKGLVHVRNRMAESALAFEPKPEPPPQPEPKPPLPGAKEPERSHVADAPLEPSDTWPSTTVDRADWAQVTKRRRRFLRKRRLAQDLVRRVAILVLLFLGLLAAAVAVMAILQVGLFDPTRREYERAMRPLLTEYDVWWDGPQGALFDELNSRCGPGADGWSNRDVLLTCSTHPTVDCGRLVAHCGADVEAMRERVDALSRDVQMTGRTLLASFDGISPPDDIVLAHSRFLSCLESQVADADRVGRLARGEPAADSDHVPACQMFSSAEAEVQAYVGSQ